MKMMVCKILFEKTAH